MDIPTYINTLNSNTDSLLKLICSCPPDKLNSTKNGQWSILQIAEHICLTDEMIHSMLLSHTDSVHEKEEIIGDEKLKKILVGGRSHKVLSPGALIPKGSVKDYDTFKELLTMQRAAIVQNLQEGVLVVDNRAFKHPFLGEMTISDWLYFIIHHTQRHHDQIKDLLDF